MSGTVTGGTQDYNNIVGTGGVNCATVTNQTSVSGQYITAESLTATTSGATVTYTITGQRGASISYDETTNLISGGKDWDYKNDGTEVTDYGNTHTFTESGSFLSKVHLYNPSNTTGVTLQLSTPVTPIFPPTISIVGSLSRRTYTLTPTYSDTDSMTWYWSADQTTWTQFSTTLGTTTYTFPSNADGTYYFKCVATNTSGDTTSNIISQYAMYGGSGGLTNHDQSFIGRW